MTEKRIFGLTWDQIQKAQQKQEYREVVLGPVVKSQATPADVALLEKMGQDGLEKDQLHGVLDRLRTSGFIK